MTVDAVNLVENERIREIIQATGLFIYQRSGIVSRHVQRLGRLVNMSLDDSVGQKRRKDNKEEIGGHQQKVEGGIFGKRGLYMIHTHKIRQNESDCKNTNLHETASCKKCYFCPLIKFGL